jgi:hypothetical protein
MGISFAPYAFSPRPARPIGTEPPTRPGGARRDGCARSWKGWKIAPASSAAGQARRMTPAYRGS